MTGMEHTGGMIALIPRAEDRDALTVRGGESPDELHLTLAYLGDDVTTMDSATRNEVTASVARIATEFDPVAARVFGHAVFNPDGVEHKPCVVYLVGDVEGRTDISLLYSWVDAVRSDRQHSPFFAHVTAGYGVPFARLSFTGPITFDVLRVTFADLAYDFPLGLRLDEKALAFLSDIETGTPTPIEDRIPAAIQAKVMSADPNAAKLREYWAHGAGREKWRPGTPGGFKRLRRNLAKYVQNPRVLDGLTANIYKIATGEWPGHKTAESQPVTVTAEQFKAAMLLADPDADLDDELMASLTDFEEVEDEEDGEVDSTEEAYEQALVDEVDWRINANAELERVDPPDSPYDDEEDEADAPRPRPVGVALF